MEDAGLALRGVVGWLCGSSGLGVSITLWRAGGFAALAWVAAEGPPGRSLVLRSGFELPEIPR